MHEPGATNFGKNGRAAATIFAQQLSQCQNFTESIEALYEVDFPQ